MLSIKSAKTEREFEMERKGTKHLHTLYLIRFSIKNCISDYQAKMFTENSLISKDYILGKACVERTFAKKN